MRPEPFVMRDEDRALEWVRVFSESCGVASELAAGVLSALCGFGSWDVMMFAISEMPPSPCDEAIPSEQVHERRRRYIQVMTHEFSIKPSIALMVSHHLSPSTGSRLETFSSTNVMQEFETQRFEDDLDEFDIDQLFAAEASELGLGVVLPLAYAPSQNWERVFQLLGWIVEPNLVEFEVVGTPAFVAEDPSEESLGFPVYLAHDLPAPTFDRELSDNPTVRLLQCACLGDFTAEWARHGCSSFLLLTAYPQITQLNGKYYTYVGQAFLRDENQWVDLLLNKTCTDVTTLISLNQKVTEDFRGATKLGERTEVFYKRLAMLLSGFDPEYDDVEDWCLLAVNSPNTWTVVRAVECDDYELDDLEPFLLAPLRRF